MEKLEIKKPETKQEIPVPEFKLEEFEQSREELESLVKQLMPAIKNHEYNIIVGDDASGRIPTLILGGLMKEIYKKDNATPPQILFFAGRHLQYYEGEENLVSEFFQKLEKQKEIKPSSSNALVVTEYMSTGATMVSFVKTFKKLGLSCDVATLVANGPERHYKDKYDFNKIYIGNALGGVAPFYGSRIFAGVKQKPEDKIFASPLNVYREMVITARKDSKKMIEYLKQIYEREKEKIEEKDSV
jgi:adenine/guanine phosphoribosyltransferase-like PRPP-binding protein